MKIYAMMNVEYRSSTSFNLPIVDRSNPTDARPAIFVHLGEIFHTVKISRHIRSFFMSSFLANGVGFVDVINAEHLKVMRAGCRCEVE